MNGCGTLSEPRNVAGGVALGEHVLSALRIRAVNAHAAILVEVH
ncbi:hypothetical protein [Halobellus sp. H-GB7]|nr:hypothetical protein [Halobellus sp. H-GB7]MDQ2054830.1 hypothetical protein [Halobellus sp. H-GB7]